MDPNSVQPGQSITPNQPVQPINGVVSENNPYTQSSQVGAPAVSPQPMNQEITPSPMETTRPLQSQPLISEVQPPAGVVMPQPQQASTPLDTQNLQPTQSKPVVGPVSKKPKFILILVVGLVLLAGMTVAGIMLTKPKKNAVTNSDASQNQQQKQPDKLQPASALDVEQVNTSINQDISGIDDEVDFPPTQLDDKALEL